MININFDSLSIVEMDTLIHQLEREKSKREMKEKEDMWYQVREVWDEYVARYGDICDDHYNKLSISDVIGMIAST